MPLVYRDVHAYLGGIESKLIRDRLLAGIVIIMLHYFSAEDDNQLYPLPPHHLINNPHITLNDLHDLSADILIYIIRHRNTVASISAELHSSIDCLEERLGVNAGDDEVGFVNSLRTLSAGAYADCRERMAYAGEERRLLWESSRI